MRCRVKPTGVAATVRTENHIPVRARQNHLPSEGDDRPDVLLPSAIHLTPPGLRRRTLETIDDALDVDLIYPRKRRIGDLQKLLTEILTCKQPHKSAWGIL